MTKDTYEKMTTAFRQNPKKLKVLILMDKLLTKIAYIAYPVLLVFLLIKKEPELLRAVFVPGISFVAVSCFRYLYCAPRPYEVFGIPPVIPKDTKGKSFPSRHVFSIFIIAMTFLYFLPWVGIIIGAAGTFMAVIRVLGGVHFPKDVIAGAVMGIVCGIIGFYL